MKIVLLISVFLFSSLDKLTVSDIRKLYVEAASVENKAELLLEKTEAQDLAVLKGYHGAAHMLMAKYYVNPLSKWNAFSKGKDILEKAIQQNPNNAELRFLRLGIQQNVPSFLGYHNQIEMDINFLKKELASIQDKELQSLIYNYLKTIQ
jgi:hypothetical protein